MDGTRTIQLITVSVSWLESNLVEDLLHGDLSPEHLEVNTWQDHLLVGWGTLSHRNREEATGTSELSCGGLFFAATIDKTNSLNDIREPLGAVQ